ncbi:unnamed protein product [Prorocentrum cordatum]|uniref:TLDc domain-containing protein n=1 Tax=Prorocentrum cordatum TaxID=2364126 RepID=A0ABN9TPH2_9DINO|nr:unnamed protein product [Polarella glacialis]
MGASGAPSRAAGTVFGALASRAVQAADSSVHVVVGLAGDFQDDVAPGALGQNLTSSNCVLPGATSSSRLLEFAEWCNTSSPEALGRAAFLSELAAMQAGLDELDLPDRALAADLLAAAFVEPPQILGLPDGALKAELQAWQAVCKACRPVGRPAQYISYRDLPTSAGELQRRTDAAVVLLQTAALQSAIAVGRAIGAWRSSGAPRDASFGNNSVLWGDRRASGMGDTNTEMLVQHLDGARKSMFSPDSRSRARTSSFNPSISLPDFLQECIQVSADFEQRRAAVMEALIRRCPVADSSADSSLCHYAKWVPGQRRVFSSEAHDGGSFESWGAEVFASLDGGALTHPKELIRSLGHGAPPYTEMSTNSKSGEFFFFSGDRRFLISR